MSKFIIAEFKLEFTYHCGYFFDQRMKAYEGEFDEPDFIIHSRVNNDIKDEEGEVSIGSPGFKQVKDANGVIHQICYKNEEGFIAQKISFYPDMKRCTIELIDHKHKMLTLDEREYIATCLAFYHLAALKECVMIHSSAIKYKGEAILFSADSGTGKSTHTQLWQKVFDIQFINDDKPLVKLKDGQYRVYGTPWSGKTDLNNNIDAPLKALVMLERGEKNEIEKVELLDVIKSFFANINLVKEDPEIFIKSISVYNDILASVPLYRLRCTISEEAPRIVEQAIFGL